jgi:protein-S-isoprenylcysteine O-methyltransferase Ste14
LKSEFPAKEIRELFLLKWIDFWCSLSFGIFVCTRFDGSARWYAGMPLGVFGMAMWATARIQLGKSFSVTAQARKMVTTGLYSKIRNPIYFFAGVGYAGFIIAWGNWYALTGILFYFIFQFLRARSESKVLEAAFGDEYRRYRAQTWF